MLQYLYDMELFYPKFNDTTKETLECMACPRNAKCSNPSDYNRSSPNASQFALDTNFTNLKFKPAHWLTADAGYWKIPWATAGWGDAALRAPTHPLGGPRSKTALLKGWVQGVLSKAALTVVFLLGK